MVRSYIYTGKYNSKLLSNHKRLCEFKIAEIDKLIEGEENLLKEISQTNEIKEELKEKVKNHVTNIKKLMQKQKEKMEYDIKKHKKNSIGQKGFFKYIYSKPFIEMKVRDLKLRSGLIIQKGVDVNMASDIVHLAHTHSYDVAILLGGDTDLRESVRIARKGLGKIVIIVSYYDKENRKESTISGEMVNEADYFINLKDFEEKDIKAMSELYIPKQDKN